MESGNKSKADIIKNNENTETEINWEDFKEDDDIFVATFVAHALQKQKVRERFIDGRKKSVPEIPYKYNRRRIERNLGHVGTSILDVREKTTDRQAIRQEFKDHGGFNIENLEDEKIISPEKVFKKFNVLFTFLGENTNGNPNLLEEYRQIDDKKEKLRFILESSLADKVRLFYNELEYPNYDNFLQRLQFQQDFINGTARVWDDKWNSLAGKYVKVQRLLDPAEANVKDISLGLNRASLKSAMIGTPEYGAYKIAMDIKKDYDLRKTPDFPEINGYWSGITNTRIGSWETIIDEYGDIADKIAKRNSELNEEELEHLTVRKVAKIFADSLGYNDPGRGPESPYVSRFHESVAWAQLGEGAQRQLRGMRQKISYSNLKNIERFIGKSGYSQKRKSFESESARLKGRVKHILELSKDDKEAFLVKENAFEIKKQEEWREKEVARINHKYNKLIDKTRSEERKDVFAKRRKEEVRKVTIDTSSQIEYFENRTLDGLFSDIEKRQELLSRRIEKRKSLAEKAIDLHFQLEVDQQKWDNDSEEYIRVKPSRYSVCLDWINDAPLGVIKRSHKRMVEGVSADDIYVLAIGDIFQKVLNDSEQVDNLMWRMYGNDDNLDVYAIRNMVRLAGRLSKSGEKLSYSELEAMSKQDTRWIEESLAMFPMTDVKRFLDNELNLSLVPKISRVANQFGYNLDTDQLINLASKRIINSYYFKTVESVFSSTLKNFSLEEAISAMDANVDLRVLNKTRSILSTEGITDFSDILDRATKLCRLSDDEGGHEKLILDYCNAITSLGLKKADILLARGVNLGTFNMISRKFSSIVDGDFDKTLELSDRVSAILNKRGELDKEESSIRTLRTIDNGKQYTEIQIADLYKYGILANDYKEVFINSDRDKNDIVRTYEKNNLNFDDKVKLLKNSMRGSFEAWRIREAIEHFDDDVLHKIAAEGADVVRASRIKYLLNKEDKYAEFNTMENVLYLASNNLDVDVFLRATEAGFSVDEIKLYPFLASDLLIKERTK